jgi:hypothetical protein
MSNDMYIFVDYSIFMHPYPIRGGSKGWKIDQWQRRIAGRNRNSAKIDISL